jgi:hypothetical protein
MEVYSEGDISVLNVGSVDYNSFPLMNKFESLISRMSGFASVMSGGSVPGDPRASGKKVEALIGQGSIRIDAMFRRLNNMLANRARQIISLYAQYGDDILKYRRWDDETKGYVEDSIDAMILQQCKFRITLNAMQYNTSEQQEKQEELWFYETILKNPLLTLPPMQLSQYSQTQLESIMEITKQLFDKYGKSNKERLLPKVETLMKSIQQTIAAQIEGQIKQAMAQTMQQPALAPHEVAKADMMADNKLDEIAKAAKAKGQGVEEVMQNMTQEVQNGQQ